MTHATMLLTKRMTAYAILVAMEERNLDMPHGPHSMEQEAAPQHDAPTDQTVAAEGRRRAGTARMAPMLKGVDLEVRCQAVGRDRGNQDLTVR